MNDRPPRSVWYAKPLRRLCLGFVTWPTFNQWMMTAVWFAAFAGIAIPVGLYRGFLKYEPSRDPWWLLALYGAVAFVVPCLVEETLFRVLLMPHPSETPSFADAASGIVLAVTLFVAWHPLAGVVFGGKARELFFDAVFLGLCALFGLLASVAYVRTGSIWPGVFMHWAIVVVWKLYFGGWITALGGARGG